MMDNEATEVPGDRRDEEGKGCEVSPWTLVNQLMQRSPKIIPLSIAKVEPHRFRCNV
jgi:hypothetical protein